MLRINVEKHKLPSKCFLSHLSETSLVIIPNYFRLNPFIIISFASPGDNGVFNGCCFFPPFDLIGMSAAYTCARKIQNLAHILVIIFICCEQNKMPCHARLCLSSVNKNLQAKTQAIWWLYPVI